MVYRGCVVKIEENFAIAMTREMDYLKIIKKDGLEVGKEILFVEEDLYHKENRKWVHKGIMAAVLLLMVLSMGFLGEFNPFGPVSYGAAAVVSIDINPSLEFEIDGERKVLKGIPINDDGEKLFNKEWIGLPIDEVILQVIKLAKEKNYLTSVKNSVLISTVIVKDDYKMRDEQFKKDIEEKLEKKMDDLSLNIVYVNGNKEDIEIARENKISQGKYAVYKKTVEQDKRVNVQKIKNMKVQEMVDKEMVKHPRKEKEKSNGKVENVKGKMGNSSDQKEFKEKHIEEKEKKDLPQKIQGNKEPRDNKSRSKELRDQEYKKSSNQKGKEDSEEKKKIKKIHKEVPKREKPSVSYGTKDKKSKVKEE